MNSVDTEADEECLTYEATGKRFEWQTCGGGGSGDVTDVGDCSTGACFTADGTGNQLLFEGWTADANEVTVAANDPGSDVTVYIPATAGTLYVSSGTDVSLADGGTARSLTDPNDDRIFYWDDGVGQSEWLDIGTGLSLTGTTIRMNGRKKPRSGDYQIFVIP